MDLPRMSLTSGMKRTATAIDAPFYGTGTLGGLTR